MKGLIRKAVVILIALCSVLACLTACGGQTKSPVVRADGMLLVWDGTSYTHSFAFALADHGADATVEDVLRAAKKELELDYTDGEFGMMIGRIGSLSPVNTATEGQYVMVSTNASQYASEYSEVWTAGGVTYASASVGVGSIRLEQGLVVVFSIGTYAL